MKHLVLATLLATAFMGFSPAVKTNSISFQNPSDTILFPGEKHFANVQQLTFGGDNAEAYFSFDGKYIIFQKTNPKEGIMCDQMFIGKVPAPGENWGLFPVLQFRS